MITELKIYKIIKELILTEQKLEEGLILTHDIYDSKNILENIISKWFWCDIQIVDNKFSIILDDGKFTVETYIEFLILINNLGYFISIMKVTNDKNIPKPIKPLDFKENYLDDKYLNKFIKYEIILEPKYDIKHQLKTNVLYHVTEQKYIERINKNGLIVKSKNTKTHHPERIYCVYNLEDAKAYIKSKNFYYLTNRDDREQPNKTKFKEIKFEILKITLPEDNDIVFYEDPNFKGKGIYTYDNISSNYIEVQ